MRLVESTSAAESKVFIPSRIMPPTDSSELGDMSPHPSIHPLSIEADVPLPLPQRPPPFVASVPRREMPPPATANPPKKDNRPKPYTVEPPAAAPRYAIHTDAQVKAGGSAPKIGYADFFPWTGNHPEDQFSDDVIRNGYYNKALYTPAETQSAKNILFPALKHKTGLTALSSVFTAVLGQRRHNGQITAPSTFKPPPRVTLTDTKRESWLKDLANPAISLRRLSRTIPHGIRGKILLEQCLNKRVPTDRAVWLIKTRLAAHLYAEYLLDREHFSEWLVSNLENSSDAKLPMWMLITQLYWKDLLKMRRYGRRLVTALISHHHLIYNHPDKDILHPLLESLTQCLNTLILSSPENFVSPSTWSKYRDALKACLPAGDQARHNSFGAINLRNEQLAAAANRSQPAARHILVRMLDGTLQNPMSNELPAQCWGISKDKDALARALLEWCTSLYRPGLAKIYVTSRILQHWSTLGLDSTATVLDFLEADACEEKEHKSAFYHVVCELVRSEIFSVPRYIQWLMARGGTRNPELVSRDGPAPTRLLVEVPTHALAPSQRDLRGEMLRRASFSVADAAADVELALKHLKHTLGMSTDPTDLKPLSLSKFTKKIASADRALKAELGWWLRANFAAHAEEREREGNQAPEISPALFYAVRSVLEAAEDFSMIWRYL
ncbi:hypothetical protein CHGG_06342 [Chaetomium globosum CBS 148.51]|uniref:Mediator of RNA polymerase II transcription subunit 12 n=1 Tax=Chaetomium globosum (strain ATCC 6205 / CBS 148.51 / DSM 1962 / NBRC 6347 / NRRL 1970) TaxID=306901 RepID=Q2H4S3_CHAGB|nr:uncharacterized protein CHGG_06342 [Chaetomium globosum CBS 148.51]EAQ89723.1 hypothetical protein CHGG_06342 [Chaetomium globosum CBS 148.51]